MLGLLGAALPARAGANLHVSPGILDFGMVSVGGSATQSFITLADGTGFFSITMTFEFATSGIPWQPKVLDAGYYELVSSKLKKRSRPAGVIA